MSDIDLVAEGQVRLARNKEKAVADYGASRQARFSLIRGASLEKLIADARAAGQLPAGGSNRDAATLVVCALEGAMLISRPLADKSLLSSALRQLLAGLQARS